MVLCNRLLPLSSRPSSFALKAVSVLPSFLTGSQHAAAWTWQVLSIRSPVDGHVDCFRSFANRDKTAGNIHTQVRVMQTHWFLWTHTEERNGCVRRWLRVPPFEELPDCFPKRLHRVLFPPGGCTSVEILSSLVSARLIWWQCQERWGGGCEGSGRAEARRAKTPGEACTRAPDLSPGCAQLAVWPQVSLPLSLCLRFLTCKMKASDQWVSTGDSSPAKAGAVFGCHSGWVISRDRAQSGQRQGSPHDKELAGPKWQ